MSGIKRFQTFFSSLKHGGYDQISVILWYICYNNTIHNTDDFILRTVPLFDAKKISIFSCRGLVRSVTTSERADGKALAGEAAVASEGKNGKWDSDQTAFQKRIRGGPISWLGLGLLLLTGGGLLVYYDKEKKQHIEGLRSASSTVKQGPSVGSAAIGGPFKLVNHHGKTVTEKDFLGKWTLIYFGFTYCPDICPDELQKMAAAIDKIKAKAGLEVVPVFISVDPERDNVEQVSEYVKEFHPNLVGLTGTSDDVRQVARAYRVYYMKTEEEGSDYLVDHSIVMYLMNPKMEFVKFFGKNYSEDTLSEGVINAIKEHNQLEI